MKGISRMTRVNELLKREIADLIKKYVEYGTNCIVSVTEVDVAPSLRNAKVFVSILGVDDTSKQEIMKKIEKKRKLIQEQMSNHVVLKYTPVLSFKLDLRVEAGDNVLAILQELEQDDE